MSDEVSDRRERLRMKGQLDAHRDRSVSDLLWEVEDGEDRRALTVCFTQILELPELGEAL